MAELMDLPDEQTDEVPARAQAQAFYNRLDPNNPKHKEIKDAFEASLKAHGYKVPVSTPLDKTKDVLMGAASTLEKGLKASQIPMTQTGGPVFENILSKMYPGKETVTPEEKAAALDINNVKQYPSSALMMERAGVPEYGKLSDLPYLPTPIGKFPIPMSALFKRPKNPESVPWYDIRPTAGGPLDITGRGTLGTAIDVARDPLTVIGGPIAKGLSKIPPAIRAAESLPWLVKAPAWLAAQGARYGFSGPSAAIEDVGRSLYNRGTSGYRAFAAKQGAGIANEVTPTFKKYGITGGPESMLNKIENTKKTIWDQVSNIRKEATQKGAKVPIQHDLFNFEQKVADVVNSGVGLSPEEGQQLVSDIYDAYAPKGKVFSSLEENAQRIKNLRKGLPSKTWMTLINSPDKSEAAKQLQRELADTLRASEKNAIDMTVGGKSSEYNRLMKDYGVFANVDEQAQREFAREAATMGGSLGYGAQKAMTEVPGLVTGAAVAAKTGSPLASVGGYLGAKGVQAIRAQGPSTVLGNLMEQSVNSAAGLPRNIIDPWYREYATQGFNMAAPEEEIQKYRKGPIFYEKPKSKK